MPRGPSVPDDDAIRIRPGFLQPFRPGQSIRHIRKGPTILKPAGRQLTLPRPIAVIDGREHDGYTFNRFANWFAGIERRNLATGDYTIQGLETRIAVERKTLNDLYASTSPDGHRPAFLQQCERLATFEYKLLIIEASLDEILTGHEQHSDYHPNAVLGTLEALAARWAIHPWFAGSRDVGEEITVGFLSKAYQLCALEANRLPRRFQVNDI